MSRSKLRVWRKPLTCASSHFRSAFLATWIALAAITLGAEPPASTNDSPKFLGATSCASSGCHGGGGQNQNQFHVWSLKDFHSQRSFATLTTARSKQIGDALGIKAPTTDSRCTSCHAPLASIPVARRGETFKVSEGVSCESCHGPAENWLRSHTRPDWRHADRTAAGLRDLKSLYARANTCVACHQTVDSPLLQAGHPELTFELDGQSASQPRHWREGTNASGAQAWLVGQATALREMSWQLSREREPDSRLAARWSALLWLLQRMDGLSSTLPKLGGIADAPAQGNFESAIKAADELARRAGEMTWTRDLSRAALRTLVGTESAFRQTSTPVLQQARRAERLVMALDRVLKEGKAKAPEKAEVKLDELFQQVQSLPDFDPTAFAKALAEFGRALPSGN